MNLVRWARFWREMATWGQWVNGKLICVKDWNYDQWKDNACFAWFVVFVAVCVVSAPLSRAIAFPQSVINITNTKQCVYFSRTNLLFYLNFWPLVNVKREASKSRDNIIIKGTQAVQERNLYHICHHKQSPTMRFSPSSLKHRPEANSRHHTLQNISLNPSNAAVIKTMRFLWTAT